ncbi:Beta-galactosidase C-terminal domain [Streptomyces coeruleorubidus]|uniref:Beta-galactosidase C-terminal domain n=1 Tax=Streptomyces coeruleorubidus TaxID=116188 RepID=UPI003CD03B05
MAHRGCLYVPPKDSPGKIATAPLSIGTGRPVPVATAGAVQLLTGKLVEGGTVTVPPGQVAVVRESS